MKTKFKKNDIIKLQNDGFVHVKNLIPESYLTTIKDEIETIISNNNYIDNQIIIERKVYSIDKIHLLPFIKPINELLQSLTKNRLFIHPKIVVRIIPPKEPSFQTNPHQDYYTVRGTTQTFTVWIPLHNCTIKNGSLKVIVGSHKEGFLETIPGYGVGGVVLKNHLNSEWQNFEFVVGDVLIFNSLTIHSANYNSSNNYRLSIDFRFQDFTEEIHPATLMLQNEYFNSWNDLYQVMPQYINKFYWKNFKLNFSPSLKDLNSIFLKTTDSNKKIHLMNLIKSIIEQE